jgi:hypothetical protein
MKPWKFAFKDAKKVDLKTKLFINISYSNKQKLF